VSIITLPTGIYFGSFVISQKRFDLKEMSDTTGTAKERLMSPPRWRLSIGAPSIGVGYTQAALWKNMVLQLRGSINHLAAYDVAQPVPVGTMRGAPVLSAQLAAGATSMSITAGTANGTLKVGDWLQIGTGLGSQLVSVAADVTLNGSGAGTVTFEPPARVTFPATTTAITWDKPVAYYKQVSDSASWAYTPGALLVQGFNLDLMEQWQ
jgi:hypothetical protein